MNLNIWIYFHFKLRESLLTYCWYAAARTLLSVFCGTNIFGQPASSQPASQPASSQPASKQPASKQPASNQQSSDSRTSATGFAPTPLGLGRAINGHWPFNEHSWRFSGHVITIEWALVAIEWPLNVHSWRLLVIRLPLWPLKGF